jgi:polysaccharide biosynthesis protein PslH
MRILFVSTNLPVPADNGSAIRSLAIVQALASSGHELSFVAFAPIHYVESVYPLSAYCSKIDLLEREIPNVSKGSDYLRRTRCLFSFKPYSVERFRSDQMQARIQHHLSDERFDLILCDSIYALVNVPQTAVPIVLNCHNIEHLIFERYSRIENNFLKKYYAIVEAHWLRDAERHSCRRAAIAMVCSKVDRETLHQLHANMPIFVVPNAVDTDSYRPDERNGSQAVLLFLGGMDWYPNRDAVEFFVRRILPMVRAEVPILRFVVAGRNPPIHFVEELGVKHGIEFTGTVPDTRPYLSAATVVVVPLRFGSGTRIKILEACAAGKPVVSTNVGAEGLGLEGGKEIILADDPAEFARSVITLLRDRPRRNAISKSARAVVVDRYSLPTLKRNLDVVLSAL